MKSILQDDKCCRVCGNPIVDLHHVRLGNCHRKTAEKHGLVVWLCRKHHIYLHNHPMEKEKLQREAQKRFEELHSHKEYMKIFHKNYLKGDE